MAGASRSLGRLTLDLVAQVGGFVQGMQRVQQSTTNTAQAVNNTVSSIPQNMTNVATQVQQQTSAIESNLGNFRTNVAGILAGLGIGALIGKGFDELKESIDKALDIEKFSKLVGQSTNDFQIYALAASKAGIEMEKFADITKDVQDKIGDFTENDAGPLKDFFDNIAPAVGVTIEQFKKLSGPEALQLYIKSLKDAGANSQQVAFYMEALASDSTLLFDALSQSNLDDVRKQAEDLGVVIRDDMILSAQDAKDQMFELDMRMAGVKNTISSQLLPYILELTDELFNVKNGLLDASDAADILETAINILVGGAMIATATIQGLTQGAISLANHASLALSIAKGDVKGMSDAYRNIQTSDALALEQKEKLIEGWKRMSREVGIDRENAKKRAEEARAQREQEKKQQEERMQETIKQREELRKNREEESKKKKETESALADANKQYQALVKQGEQAGYTTEKEKVLWEIRNGNLKLLDEERQKQAIASAELIDSQKSKEKAMKSGSASAKKAFSDTSKEAEKLAQENKKILERYEDMVFNLKKQTALAGNTSEFSSLQYDILNGKLDEFNDLQKENLLNLTRIKEETIKQAEIEKEVRKEAEEKIKQEKQEREQMLKDAEKVTENYLFEIELLGKTREEIELLSLAREFDAIKGTEQYEKMLEALVNIQEQAKISQKEIEMMDTVRDAAKGLFEDLSADPSKWKDSFINALESIRAKMASMVAEQLMQKILGGQGTNQTGWLSGLFSGGGSGGGSGGFFSSFLSGIMGRASGGAVASNSMYRVNESGMEMLSVSGKDYLLTGNQGGTITPTQHIKKSSSTSQVNNFVINGKIDRRTQEQIANETGKKITSSQNRNI